MVRAKPPTIHLKDYRPPTHLVETVALDVKLDAVDTRVRSRLSVVPNPVSPEKGAPLALDGEGIELHAVRLDGRQLAPSAYEAAGKRLVLHAPPARRFELEIETGCSPKANTELSGLYLSNGIYCTQCEAEGFRRITYFPDRPDVLSRFSVRLEADKNEAPVLLANGNLKESGDVAGTRPALRAVGRSVPQALLPLRHGGRRPRRRRGRLHNHVGPQGRAAHLRRDAARRTAAAGRWNRSRPRWRGTRRPSAASTISTSSWWWRCRCSTWAPWRTRASTSSTTNTCWRSRRAPPTSTT